MAISAEQMIINEMGKSPEAAIRFLTEAINETTSDITKKVHTNLIALLSRMVWRPIDEYTGDESVLVYTDGVISSGRPFQNDSKISYWIDSRSYRIFPTYFRSLPEAPK